MKTSPLTSPRLKVESRPPVGESDVKGFFLWTGAFLSLVALLLIPEMARVKIAQAISAGTLSENDTGGLVFSFNQVSIASYIFAGFVFFTLALVLIFSIFSREQPAASSGSAILLFIGAIAVVFSGFTSASAATSYANHNILTEPLSTVVAESVDGISLNSGVNASTLGNSVKVYGADFGVMKLTVDYIDSYNGSDFFILTPTTP